jgi:RNA polymerase sigma-32 factor
MVRPIREENGALEHFARKAARIAILDEESERKLATRYRRTGRADLARRLIRSNLRLVLKIAYEYRWATVDVGDLVQEGNLGLLHAIRHYDPDRGVRLAGYAAIWVRAFIRRYLTSNHRLVRIGTTTMQRRIISRHRRASARIEAEHGHVDPELLAKEIDAPAETIATILPHLSAPEISLDAPIDEAGSAHRIDRIAAPEEDRPDRRVEDAEIAARFAASLDAFEQTLTTRQRFIFRERWRGEAQPSLQMLGDRLGITRERVRQLEARILDRLRVHLAGSDFH